MERQIDRETDGQRDRDRQKAFTKSMAQKNMTQKA